MGGLLETFCQACFSLQAMDTMMRGCVAERWRPGRRRLAAAAGGGAGGGGAPPGTGNDICDQTLLRAGHTVPLTHTCCCRPAAPPRCRRGQQRPSRSDLRQPALYPARSPIRYSCRRRGHSPQPFCSKGPRSFKPVGTPPLSHVGAEGRKQGRSPRKMHWHLELGWRRAPRAACLAAAGGVPLGGVHLLQPPQLRFLESVRQQMLQANQPLASRLPPPPLPRLLPLPLLPLSGGGASPSPSRPIISCRRSGSDRYR